MPEMLAVFGAGVLTGGAFCALYLLFGTRRGELPDEMTEAPMTEVPRPPVSELTPTWEKDRVSRWQDEDFIDVDQL